ncbi:MAG: hypothetical protein ACWGQW_01190 [bacterium]
MAVTILILSDGDTDYITRHNTNYNNLKVAVEALQAAIGGGTDPGASLAIAYDAMYGPANAVLGVGSYLPYQQAAHTLRISTGFAYLTDTDNVVTKATTTDLDFSGQTTGTHYVVVDDTGVPSRSDTATGALYSVYYNSATGDFSSIAREANLVWTQPDWDDAITDYWDRQQDSLDDRLTAAEKTSLTILEKTAVATDLTLTEAEAFEQALILLSDGPQTADIDLIIPDKARVYHVLNDGDPNYSTTIKTSSGVGYEIDGDHFAIVYCDGTDTTVIFDLDRSTGPGASTTFLTLTDTPGTFSGNSGKTPVVNANENALEFIQNPFKRYVKVAATTNLSLSGTDTVDGVSLTGGERVLAPYQTDLSETGIYVVASGGAWPRAADADTWDDLVSAAVVVSEGTVNADTIWICKADEGGTLGTTDIEWESILTAGGVHDTPVDGATTIPISSNWAYDHENASDPHPGYLTPTEADALYEAIDSTILREADVDDTPVDGVTTAPVSSNWAYDHVAAADPHTGYRLESADIDLAADVTGTLPAANGGTGQTALTDLDVDTLGSGTATNGQAPIANGSGGIAWGDVAASGGGGTGAPQIKIASCHKASGSDTMVADTYKTATFDTEDVDELEAIDLGTDNDRITVPAGVSRVQVFANISFGPVGSGGYRNSIKLIHYNSSDEQQTQWVHQDLYYQIAFYPYLHITSPVVTVQEGDYFIVQARTKTIDTSCSINVAVMQMTALEFGGANSVSWAVPHRGALVYLTANESINGSTPIPWDATLYDTDSFWSASNPTRLTVPAGVSKVRLVGSLNGASATGQLHISFDKNGANTYGLSALDTDTTGADFVSTASAVIEVEAGDYFQLRGYTDTTRTITSDTDSWFAIEVVEASADVVVASYYEKKYTISGASEVEVELPADYDTIYLDLLDIQPATDDVYLRVQYSTDGGSTWKSGATDYAYFVENQWIGTTDVVEESTGEAYAQLARHVGNDTGEGIPYLRGSIANHGDSAATTIFIGEGFSHSAAANIGRLTFVNETNFTTVVTHIKFYFSSGNISSGEILARSIPAQAVPYYREPVPKVYDVAGYLPGKGTASSKMLVHVFADDVTFPASLAGSVGTAETAATAQTDYDIQKNGSSVGTMRFAAAGSTASFIFATSQSFTSGDKLQLVAPATLDTTLADISLTLSGSR